MVITAQVRLGSDAATGIYTNKAFVTTQDDPACAGAGCVPACTVPLPIEVSAAAIAANNVDCEDTPAGGAADLQIIKSVSNSNPDVGSSFEWILDVTNLGPSSASNIVVVDDVPAVLQVTGVTSTDSACSHAGNSVSCTRTSMAPATTGRIRIAVLLPAGANVSNIINVATVSAATPDPDLANNTDSESVVPRSVASEAPAPPAARRR